jgi:hypothetical protein
MFCAGNWTFTFAEAPRVNLRTNRFGGSEMPHIIVTADEAIETGERPVMLRERVSCADFESDHFASQLVERLGWAVGDAAEVERHREKRERPYEVGARKREMGDSRQDTSAQQRA